MANLRNTVVTGSLRLASHGAGMVRTDANGSISTAAMTAGDLPSHNHDDRYYTESEINSLLSGKQDAATAITTSNIGSQSVNYANSAGTAGQVSGISVSSSQMQYLKNTLDSTSLPYTCDIYVDGDANTYYPVHFIWGDQDVWRRIIIKRGYSEEAPWDPVGSGVHHGGLLLDWEGNFGGWGGAEYSDRLRVFNESYTNVCADMYIYTHSMGYVFMLRGGHALYHIFSDQPIRGYHQTGTPDIAYNTSTLFYDHSIVGYRVYAPAPVTSVNSSRIDGLRTKKQSLFDGRYQPLENQRLSTGNSPSFSSVSANDVYTTGGWFRNHTNNAGIYWSNTGWHLMPENSGDFRFHSGNNSESAIRMETNGTTRGYVYANSSNEIGFLNQGRTWRLRVYSGGAVESYGDFRAPIFYDSQDTAYYVDPNSTSNLAASYIGRVLINYDGTDTWFRMQSGNRMRVTTTGGNDFIIPNTGDITFNGTTLATREWVQAQGYRTTDSDNQTLSVSGSTLTISGGNSVTLPTGGISQSTADGRYTRNLGQQVYVGSLNDLDGAYTVNLDGYGPINTAGGPDTAYNASLWGIGNSGRGAQIYLPYAYDQMYFRRGAGGWSSWFRVLNTSADPYPSNMDQYVRTSDSVSFQNVYATAGAGRVSAGSTSTDGMLFDSSRAALIARGNYPHVELWADVSNSNHGGTLRFGGYDNGSSGAYKSWNIGTAGSNLYFLDIGYGGYNSNPHAGIAGLGDANGYPGGFTIMRFHNNGNIGVGNFGTYGNGDNDPDYKLDVRGNGRYTGLLYLDAAESLNLYGIRGRFSNEYIHLYNKVGIGHPGGWGQGEGNTPNQGLSTYGGINIAYANDNGATINTYTRINKNWGGGDYGAEAFTIRGTYPSITLRNTGSDSKWLIHTDSSGDLRWYWGNGVDNNDWSNQITFYENGRIDASQVRASIFYDSDDTGYYLNPASTSRLNAVNYDNLYFAGDTTYGFIGRNVYADTINGRGSDPLELNYYDGGAVKIGTGTYGSKELYASMVYVSNGNAVIHAGNIGSQSVNYASSAGNSATTSQRVFSDLKINFPSGDGGGHGFGSSHYSMGLDSGNGGWSHPHYRDLIIGYHTGVRIGAHYSGIRFYNNSPTTDANNDGNGDAGEALLMTIGGYVGTADHTDVVVNNNLIANISLRAPIFYDSNDTGYYLDPASTSNLNQISASTSARWGRSGTYWTVRPNKNGSSPYWTGTNGWGTEEGTWANAWKGGFSGWDIWGTGTDHPQGGGYIHAQGIVSGQHYASGDGGDAYGWMMVGAHAATENRYWLRGKWSTSTSGWVEMISSGNIGSQSVNYAASAGNSDTTSQTQFTRIGVGQATNDNYRIITNGDYYANGGGNYWAEGRFKQYRGSGTWHDVIDSGNIGSQSVNYASSAGTASFASTSYIVNSTNDYRHSNRSPDSWHGLANSWHFNDSGTLGVSGSDYWTSVLTVVPWYGYASSHRQQQLNFGGSGGLAHRYATSGSDWSGWSRIYSDAYRPYADSAGNADTVDGYHMNQAVTVNASPTFQEVYANGWFRSTGHQGHYNPTNGAHFYANDNSYGAWKITGSRNGWGGINLQDPSTYNHYYMHESGNGGYLSHDRWVWYYHRGNNSLGLGESNTSSSYKVYVTGSLYATGDIVAYSDRRKKTDIVTIEDALSKVKEMRGVFYNKIDEAHKGRQVGVIAQEMNEVLPEAVTYAADVDEYGVKYGNIVGVLIEAIKEQQKQIEELKAKLV